MEESKSIIRLEKNLPTTEQVLEKFESFLKYAKLVFHSISRPEWCKTEGDLVIVLMTGYEMGIPMGMSMKFLYPVKGKVSVENQAMRALILTREPNATFKIVKYNEKESVVLAGMPGKEPMEFRYTIEQAQKLPSFSRNPNYQTDPALMLLNRNTARIVAAVFPHISYLPMVSETEEAEAMMEVSKSENDTEPEIIDTTGEVIEESQPESATSSRQESSKKNESTTGNSLTKSQHLLQKSLVNYLKRVYGDGEDAFETRKKEFPGLLKTVTKGKCDPGSLLSLKLNQLTDEDCEAAIENLSLLDADK